MEGSGRLRKVPPTPLRPWTWGGKPPRQPWPAREGEAHQGGGILLQVGFPTPYMEGFRWEGVGRFGRLGSPSWTPKPLWAAPQGPPGHLYNEGKGWGSNTQVSSAPWLSLVASCSTIRPRFRALI